MQQRAMGCCEAKINAKGKPAKLLTIMPQIFINDEWFGTQRSYEDRIELGKVSQKSLTCSVTPVYQIARKYIH